MSEGFDAGWLRLREPLDAAALDRPLARQFARLLPPAPKLMDLGAGTGSHVRLLCRDLGQPRQDWTLVDHDPRLLAVAPAELAGWAGEQGWGTTWETGACHIQAPGLDIGVTLRTLDLAAGLEGLDLSHCDGITAKALFDLVSDDWMAAFATALTAAGHPPLYASLNVDGRVAFSLPDQDDDFVLGLFHAHMTRDKGLGPALGPAIATAMPDILARNGYKVETASSDWQIGPEHPGAYLALLDGYEQAAREQEPAAAAQIAAWGQRRRALAGRQDSGLMVGHVDLLAWRQG